jgi:stearoyl-CoA desaturase (delta-9 desaturase)
VAILSFGEGWHNNHHAHQHSARHGLRWFELDITWLHIMLLRKLGLARRIRLAPMPGR